MPSTEIIMFALFSFVCFCFFVLAVLEVYRLNLCLQRERVKSLNNAKLHSDQLEVIAKALHYGSEVEDNDPRWTSTYDYALYFHRELRRARREKCNNNNKLN